MESKLAKLTPKVGGPSLPKTIVNTGDTPDMKDLSLSGVSRKYKALKNIAWSKEMV